MRTTLLSLSALFAVAVAAEPPKPAVRVTNPEFTPWGKFPKGTVVVMTAEGSGAGAAYKSRKKWTATTTTTITDVTADSVTLETVTVDRNDDEKPTEWTKKVTHPRLIAAPPKPRADPDRTTSEGEAEVTAGGTKYKAKTVRVKDVNFDAEGSERIEETFLNDEVPGGVVRRESWQTGTYWYNETVVVKKITTPAK